MNINLCSKCGATIPLRTFDGHRSQPRQDHVCVICEPPKQAKGGKGLGGILFHLLMFTVFMGFGVGLQKCSFEKVADIRQLARVPNTEVQAAVPGEINLRGSAVPYSEAGVLQSPDTDTPSIYFRYLVEREERDSDGDTRWVTEIDRQEYVSQFLLRDKTGEIAVRPSGRTDFNVPESFKRRQGKRRYTEYRLEPNDATFIFGYAEMDASDPSGDRMSVGFDRLGDYHPLISEKTELKERTGRATTSIITCWGGLVLIGAMTVVVFSLTGRHRLLAYFWVLSMVIGLVLCILGVAMMRSDLRAAHERVVRQNETVKGVFAGKLEGAGISWDRKWESLGDVTNLSDLTQAQRERLRRVRIDLAAAAQRVTSQSKKFPYNLVASSLNLSELDEPRLPEIDRQELLDLESKFQKAKLSGWGTWVWGIGGLVGAFLATWWGFRSVKLKRMTENLPTSPSVGVAYGLTELNGIVDLPPGIDPLFGPLSHKPCVTYDYRIHEKRGSGKNAKWVEIHKEIRRCPFLCRDREGAFPIDPEGADLMVWRKESTREGRLRYVESRLQFGDPLYAIGMAEIDPHTGDSLYLCKPEVKDYPFMLSSFTEKAVVAKRGIRAIAWMTAAFASVLLAGLMLFASRGAFSPADYLAAALVGPAYLVVLTLILHYNDLVFLRERARRNWSNIEVSLQKRYDLMPKMIEIAKSFMDHEGDLQGRLAKLRGGYRGGIGLNPELAGEFLAEGQLLGGAFMGRIENYPEIKAQTQTSLVIRQLVALEDEIAFMRQGYNDAVTQYNTRIAKFPDAILAKIGKFVPMNLLDYDGEVIPMPEIAQETWRRQQVADGAGAENASGDQWTATVLPGPDPEAPVVDAVDERIFLFASLLDEVGEMCSKQVELIRDAEGDAIAAAVADRVGAVQSQDAWSRLYHARDQMPGLRNMSAEAYLKFKGIARLLIEADDRLSTYEYALQKALGFLVDPVFTPHEIPEVRFTSREELDEPLADLIGHLSKPEEEANLGSYDQALSEVYHATAELRAEIYRECHNAFVETGGEPA
ncbi:MAG: hypothetical protein ACI9NC_006230, partial [Verrucomicrobiales bacterium]